MKAIYNLTIVLSLASLSTCSAGFPPAVKLRLGQVVPRQLCHRAIRNTKVSWHSAQIFIGIYTDTT